MFCSNCGAAVGKDVNFCSACGKQLNAVLPQPLQSKEAALAEQARLQQALLTSTAKPKRPNYIVRHFKGQLPFSLSFWVNFLLLSLIWSGIKVYFKNNTPVWLDTNNKLFYANVVFVLFGLVLGGWQFVGAWNCANREIKEKPSIPLQIGRGIVLIFLILYVLSILTGFMGLGEMYVKFYKH